MKATARWDIFCAVVDNYGDIGVCWRLARQLANEYRLQVRLWVDDLAPLAMLRPGTDALLDIQHADGVEVRRWAKTFPAVETADVVIEAFACTLPDSYVAAMAASAVTPVWINLEYLSAESWVEGAHGLASPHPHLALNKYFFFPGFTDGTGGLLREQVYRTRFDQFDPASFRDRLGLREKHRDELTVSLFGYENPALPGLLDAWSRNPEPVTCLVPQGRLLPEVQAFFGHAVDMQRGHLTARIIPFLPQRDYDALLWLCDLNFVRGEDSFVRAQWAAKPMVWQIYPQADSAHLVKLEAFLERYVAALPAATGAAMREFWLGWNQGGDAGASWPALSMSLARLRGHAADWSGALAAQDDLAKNLIRFASEKAGK